MYIYKYICIYMHICIYKYIHIYVYTHTHIHTHTHHSNWKIGRGFEYFNSAEDFMPAKTAYVQWLVSSAMSGALQVRCCSSVAVCCSSVAVCCSSVAVSCSLLQSVAVCCSLLQCSVLSSTVCPLACLLYHEWRSTGVLLQCCCSVLQRVAVCCNRLSSVFVHWRVLSTIRGDLPVWYFSGVAVSCSKL